MDNKILQKLGDKENYTIIKIISVCALWINFSHRVPLLEAINFHW